MRRFPAADGNVMDGDVDLTANLVDDLQAVASKGFRCLRSIHRLLLIPMPTLDWIHFRPEGS